MAQIDCAPHEMVVVAGCGETLLALGVISGVWSRPLAWFQLLLLIAMNTIGILTDGGTALPDSIGLVIKIFHSHYA